MKDGEVRVRAKDPPTPRKTKVLPEVGESVACPEGRSR